jgi:ABC-type oligopeptide transport system ATPase subunit
VQEAPHLSRTNATLSSKFELIRIMRRLIASATLISIVFPESALDVRVESDILQLLNGRNLTTTSVSLITNPGREPPAI